VFVCHTPKKPAKEASHVLSDVCEEPTQRPSPSMH